jgi:hypothetical protein
MAFTSYTCIDDVIKKHKVRCIPGQAVIPASDAPPFEQHFRDDLAFNLSEFPLDRSETGAGEVLMFPILREVWKSYRPVLSLFSHESLEFDSDLTGVPDYFVCKRSEFGPFYPTPPYLLVVEAKLADFAKAWGQCLAAMLAAQKLNAAADRPVYGIATNGKSWEFGVLLGNEFTQQPQPAALLNLDELGQALHAIFRKCRDMALAHTSPTSTTP